MLKIICLYFQLFTFCLIEQDMWITSNPLKLSGCHTHSRWNLLDHPHTLLRENLGDGQISSWILWYVQATHKYCKYAKDNTIEKKCAFFFCSSERIVFLYLLAYKWKGFLWHLPYTTVKVRPLKTAHNLFLWQCDAILVVQWSTCCKILITSGVRENSHLPYWSNSEICCLKHNAPLSRFIPDKCYWLADSECSISGVCLFSRASFYFSRSKSA